MTLDVDLRKLKLKDGDLLIYKDGKFNKISQTELFKPMKKEIDDIKQIHRELNNKYDNLKTAYKEVLANKIRGLNS